MRWVRSLTAKWLLFALLLGACGEPPESDRVRPVTVHFIGTGIKLERTSDGQLRYAYRSGSRPGLLFTPQPESPDCDPFQGGTLQMRLEGPPGTGVYSGTLVAGASPMEKVGDEYLLAALPLAPEAGRGTQAGQGAPAGPAAGTAESFKFPAEQGTWRLSLDWQCPGPGSARSSSEHRIDVRASTPETRAVLDALDARVDNAPAPVRVAAFEAALKEPHGEDTRRALLKNLGFHLMAAGEYGRAEASALEWREAAAKTGQLSEQLLAWIQACQVAGLRGRFREARGYLEQVATLANALDFQPVRGRIAFYRAMLFELTGQPHLALEAAIEAERQARRLNERTFLLQAEQLELRMLLVLGHHATVRKRLAEVLERSGIGPEWSNTLGWLVLRSVEAGVVAEQERAGLLERADTLFSEAFREFEAQGDLQAVNALSNRIEVAVLSGDATRARDLLEQARRRLAHRPDDRWLRLHLRLMEGRVDLLQGRTGPALEAFSAAERQAEEAESPAEPVMAWESLAGEAAFGQGEALAAAGRPDAAIEAYERALDWIQEDEAARSPLHGASMLASRDRWQARAVQVMLDQDRDLEALDLVERGVWARRKALTRASRREQLAPGEREELEALGARLEALDQGLSPRFEPRRAEEKAELERRREERQRVWSEYERRLAMSGAPVPPPLELEAILARQPADSVMLRLASLPDELVIWQIRDGRLTVRREPWSRNRLEKTVQDFVGQVQKDGLEAVEIGRTLSRLLLEPFGQPLPARLILLGDGALRSLPWGALPVGDGVLLQHTAISYWPSLLEETPQADALDAPLAAATVGPAGGTPGVSRAPLPVGSAAGTPGASRPADVPRVASTDVPLAAAPNVPLAAPVGGRVLIVADPGNDLPQAFREGQRLQQMLPGAALLARKQVTREALSTGLLEVGLFHYAGHSVVDLERPYLSSLRLADRRSFTLMDIYGLRLDGPLVYLSACSSGEVGRDGGGVLGLADGFLAAGARAVIASLWPVPDEAGAIVAERFYQRWATLAQGKAPDDAPAGVTPGLVLHETLRALALEGGNQPLKPAQLSAWLVLEQEGDRGEKRLQARHDEPINLRRNSR